MDGLALLCNLFADGPVTLKRLRRAGVRGLNDLERSSHASLATWLHASAPQARAFAEEARKLTLRLGVRETRPAATSALAARPAGERSASPATLALRPRLVPSLTETHCARLQGLGIRTMQALCESAGVTLARRTGIPYSKLLELAREGRRLLGGGAAAPRVPSSSAERQSTGALPEVEIRPFSGGSGRGREPSLAPEAVRSDEFTLPVAEPESAGPFG